MLLFLISMTCNVLLFKTLIRFRHRNMRFDVMILNKTVADMMVIFLMVPIEVLWKVTVEWVAGDPACRLLLFIKAFGHYSASMVLLCMCIDRYMLVVHPMITCDAYQRNKMMLCLAWAFSCICSIPQGIIFHVEQHPLQPSFEQCVRSNFFSAEYQRVAYNVFCMAAMYVAPLSVIIFCFTKIVGEIKKPASDDSKAGTYNRTKNLYRSYTVKMTFIIAFLYFSCWTPYVIFNLWHLFAPTSAEAFDSRIQTFLHMLAMSGSCVNPLVYASFRWNFLKCYRSIPRQIFRTTRRRVQIRIHGSPEEVQRAGAEEIVLELRRSTPVLEVRPSTPVLEVRPSTPVLELRPSTPVRQPLNPRENMSVVPQLFDLDAFVDTYDGFSIEETIRNVEFV
ncbi:hypothetical protein JTE90_013190 [Oedothorax gibbosus]|uniref:G-protein coupled receptors family 1 profile domain-containing protein n=1 Tax=Oedothorax gibbosus TaxID=931172 RepID=A0AAV6TPW3_9ARAC|nr:hypothetical protein JTE90_013190 [Oedothorax gibbosus]